MKIIEKKDFTAWRHKLVCPDCESVLEAEPSDVRAQYHEGYSDPRPGEGADPYWTYHCQCPVCQKVLDVSRTTIPKNMETSLQKKASLKGSNYFDR